MILRAATPDDVGAIAQIMGDWFTDTPFVPRLHTAREDQAFVTYLVTQNDVVVADDGGVCGFVGRDGTDIGQLYVVPPARGAGRGTQLLNCMKDRSETLALWCFQANQGARRFYERHGFVAERFTDGAENEERLPDIRYVWSAEP